MAKGFTISLSGLQSTLKNLEKQGDKIVDECDYAIGIAANAAAGQARRNAPKDTSFLAGKISEKKIKDLSWEIVAQSEYAAYMEFGTKKKVQIPAELQSYAIQYKGGKSKVNPWKAISAWCKRKGIPKEQWWFIYREIMTNGVKAHPYFFPAIFAQRRQLVRDLVDVIKKPRNI